MKALASLRRVRPSTWFYVVFAIIAAAPVWIVRHPPLTDMPFHLATIRVVHSIHDPAFGIDGDLVVALGRTQYILYYLVGSALAFVMPLAWANVVLMSAYMAGTVLALRALLRALRKDERQCFFVVPLLVNVMFMYGLLPFLVGIPLMMWGLATAVRHFERPTVRTGVLLTVLALATFYSHIFTFGIFALGVAAMFPWARPREWWRAALPLVPAAGFLLWWLVGTEAGRLTFGAVTENPKNEVPGNQPLPFDAAIGDAHNQVTNVFADSSDEILLVAMAAVALLAFGLAHGDAPERRSTPARAYVLLPVACVILYFVLPRGHGYIWLISQRFPILFLMMSIPLLRMPKGIRGAIVGTLAFAVAAASTFNACKHFIAFETRSDEVGGFEEALEHMEPGKKVCALMQDRGSSVINGRFVPYLHFGSYYQVEKGGVVMFTYTGYAHWPIQFKDGHYPPQAARCRKQDGRPCDEMTHASERWEWWPGERENPRRRDLPVLRLRPRARRPMGRRRALCDEVAR